MAVYRFAATSLITGQVLSDSIPMDVQSFSAQLSGTGSLTGSLNLQGAPQDRLSVLLASGMPPAQAQIQAYAVNRPYTEALDFRRSVIWVLRDNVPAWCGVNWDRPDMTRANGGPLQVSAQTIDSVWSHRLITDTIEYQDVDLFTAFLDLVQYGTSKQSSFISSVSPPATRPPELLAAFASNGSVGSLVIPAGTTVPQAGVTWTAGYTYSDLTQISSAWSDMTNAGAFDYAFVPGLSGTNLAVFIQLGYTGLGRPSSLSGYSLTYGQGGNVLDYGYQQMGSQGSNWIWASAAPNGSAEQWQSQYPFGVNLPDLAAGYPIMESTVAWTGSVVTSQGQVNAFADGQAQLAYEAMTTPTINIPDDGPGPSLADINLGDAFWFSATSPLHPANPDGSPGLQVLLRITGWTAYPPGPQQAAYVQLSTALA